MERGSLSHEGLLFHTPTDSRLEVLVSLQEPGQAGTVAAVFIRTRLLTHTPPKAFVQLLPLGWKALDWLRARQLLSLRSVT